eukprot:5041394-Pyramimonas_sp.AAC.2
MRTTCLREGAVEVKVSQTLEAEPGSQPGFFNSRMQLNRDLTVKEQLSPDPCEHRSASDSLTSVSRTLAAACEEFVML